MKISPRKAEISAVIELLKNGSFDTPEQGARAVITLVGDLLEQRSWRVLALRYAGSKPLLFGPFATGLKVQEFADELRIPGDHGVFWLHSPSAALVSAQAADFAPPKYCGSCTHLIEVHGLLPKRREACTIKGCDCECATVHPQSHHDTKP